ncbi:MAG: aminoacyl-tRNA hydrolase [Candidatus Taylorbacteria bacterium]|nr:aminoacyl-tRNA hydrolase [Candidatus Taylorbacteria bacterium]
MAYIIVGLGNPGEEYENTRHNTGKMILNSLAGEEKLKKEKVKFITLDTFMNNSGKGIVKYVKSVKAAEKLVVIYDDFNLPLGKIRISYNRSSGGHNGVESIIKALKTEAFIRIRIGVAPETAKGLAKVPHGDEKIEKFILGKFKDDEMKEIKKVAKTVAEMIPILVKEGREKAMSLYNAG